jgi:DHA2 family multidrug resistance protein
MRAAFMAQGIDAYTATERAYAAVFGMVQRQAAIVTFVEIFRLLGIIFLLLIPLTLLMKRPTGRGPMAAH